MKFTINKFEITEPNASTSVKSVYSEQQAYVNSFKAKCNS